MQGDQLTVSDTVTDCQVKLSLYLTIIPSDARVLGLVLSTWFYTLPKTPVQSHEVEYARADDLVDT